MDTKYPQNNIFFHRFVLESTPSPREARYVIHLQNKLLFLSKTRHFTHNIKRRKFSAASACSLDLTDEGEGGKEEAEEEISVSYVIRRGSGASGGGGGGKNLSKEDKEVEVATEVEKKAVAQGEPDRKVVEVEQAPEVEVEEKAAAAAMVSEEERADETAREEDVKKTSDDEKTFNFPAELEKGPAESMPEEKAEEAAVHGISDEVQQDVAAPLDGTQVTEEENKENIAKGVFQEKEDKIEDQETKEKEEEEEEDPSHMHEGKS